MFCMTIFIIIRCKKNWGLLNSDVIKCMPISVQEVSPTTTSPQTGCGAPLKFWMDDNKAIWCSVLAGLGGLQLMCVILCIHIIHKLKDKSGYKRTSSKRRLHDEKSAYSLWAVDHHELIWWTWMFVACSICQLFRLWISVGRKAAAITFNLRLAVLHLGPLFVFEYSKFTFAYFHLLWGIVITILCFIYSNTKFYFKLILFKI